MTYGEYIQSNINWKNYFGRSIGHPLYKGFRLVREYPGCGRKLGDFEPFTSGEFLKYPEIWEPVYHDDVLRDMKIKKILDEKED